MGVFIIRSFFVGSFLLVSISCGQSSSSGVCAEMIVAQSAGCTFTPSASNIVIGSLIAPALSPTAAQKSYQAAIALAISDLNDQGATRNPPYKVQLVVGDLGRGQDDALKSLQALYDQGVRAVVGPSESANVIALQAFASAKGMIILSNASTATTLSAQNDNIYRMVPDDSHQAEKLSAKIIADGYTNIIMIARGDLYGDDFREALRAKFNANFLTDHVLAEFQYDPTTTSFGDYAAEWRNAITSLSVNPNNTAIVLIAFEEVDQIVNSMIAVASTFFDDFAYYGTDGFSQTQDVIEDTEAAQFLLSRFLVTTSPAVTNTLSLDVFNTRLGATVTDTKSIYAALAFDATTLLATTLRDLFAKGDTSIAMWNQNLPIIAAALTGVTGNLAFDANGDRASLPYAEWGLKVDAGVYSWEYNGLLP